MFINRWCKGFINSSIAVKCWSRSPLTSDLVGNIFRELCFSSLRKTLSVLYVADRAVVMRGVTPPPPPPPEKSICWQMKPQTCIYRKIGKIWIIPAPHAQWPCPFVSIFKLTHPVPSCLPDVLGCRQTSLENQTSNNARVLLMSVLLFLRYNCF